MIKILAIDDIRDNLISLQAIIKDIIPGTEVYTAMTGPRGIELALKNDPDVILLDVVMPGMDGFEVCHQLKKDDQTSDIPVIFLTALKGDRDNRIKALEAGAEGFLTKPIDETELIAQIRAMAKIKAANQQKRNENDRLLQLVDERTEALLSELSERRRMEEILRESEKRFRYISSTISDISYSCKKYANGSSSLDWLYGATESMTGYTIDELYKLDCWGKLVIEEDFPLFKEHILNVVPGSSDVCQLRLRKKDGNIIWITATATCLREKHDQGDEVLYGSLLDITKTMEAQKALQQSEQQLRGIFENLQDAYFRTDKSGKFSVVSPSAVRMYGFKDKEELLGQPDDLLYYQSSDREMMLSLLRNTERLEDFVCQAKKKDGSPFWASMNVQLLKEVDGQITGTEGVVRDISDRKQAEDALRESEEKYRQMVNHLPDAIIVHQEGTIVFANSAAFNLLGASSSSQVLGKSAFSFVHPESRELAGQRIRKIYETGESVDFSEEKFITLRGDVLEAEVIGLPVTYQGNQAIQTIVRDITERKKAEKLIREINELNSSLLQTIPFAMDIVDEQGIVLFQNDKLKQLMGKDVLGYRCWELYRDDSTQCRDCPLLAGIQIGVTKIDESPGILGGKIFEIIHTGMNFQGEKAMLEIFMDITEKKKAEEALIDNNSRLALAMSAANMAWWKLDLSDGSVTFEKRKTEMLGYPPEKFKHYADFTSLVHPEDHDLTMNAMRDHIHGTAEKYEVEYRIKTESGEYIWYYDIGSVTKRDAQGIPLTVTGLVLNISERKQGEAELVAAKIRAEEGEQKLSLKNKELIERNKFIQTILDNLPIGLSLNDVDGGTATYMNKKFEEIYGWSSQELTSISSFFERVYPNLDYRNMLIEKVMADIQSGDSGRMHWENIVATRKDGSQRVINAINIPLIEQNTMVSTVIDITDLYKTQLDLQAAKEKAEESDRLKSAFLANMSHEIRTPLNSILGFSDLLLDEKFDQEQHAEFARMINASGNNLLTIISDIMDISKIEAGQVKFEIRPISVRELLINIHKEFLYKAEIKKLALKLDLTEVNNDLVIESDENRLRQVLINFVGNALKFTEKGYIELGVKPVDKSIQFHIRDTGIGIPFEYRDRIFERFIQVESSESRKYGGNGLGLAISKSLIEMLGGSVWVDSETGKGSTFYFQIPVANNRQSDANEPEFKTGTFIL